MVKRFLLIILSLTLIVPYAKGQYYLYGTNDPPKIDIKFTKHSVEAEKGKTIFNTLRISNQTSQTQTFNLHITAPSGWQIIGKEVQELTLAPLDSILIPVRVSVGESVRGDIGYSIIAAITDTRGNSIKNEYSFIKIPRDVDMKVKFLTRYVYFEQQTGYASIKVKVENKGNREEMLSIQLEGDSYVGITDSRLSNYVKDYNIPPYTDSTIVFDVYLNKETEVFKDIYKVNITARTIDNIFRGTTWLRNLSSNYVNTIPESRRVLVAEFIGRGLFSNYTDPTYATMVYGNLLLNKQRELNFYYSSDNMSNSDDLYKYNRMWIGYKAKNLNITIGDINKSIESNLYGRGASIEYKYKIVSVEADVTQRIINPQNNYGLKFDITPSSDLGFTVGGVYNKSLKDDFESKLGLIGTRFTLFKKYRFGFQTSFNEIKFSGTNDTLITKTALGALAFFNYNVNPLNVSIQYRSGQKLQNTSYNGRSELMVQSLYTFKNTSQLQYYISDYRNSPRDYRLYTIENPKFTNFHKELLTYGINPTPKLFVFAGPGFEYNSTDIFSVIRPGEDYFSTLTYNFNIGVRQRGQKKGSSITAQMFAGAVNVQHKPVNFIDSTFAIPRSKDKFDYQFFSINLRQPKWGIQAMYTNGPRSIYEQFSWYYGSRETRLLRIMPYFDSFIFRDIVRLMVNVSYSNDLVSKSSYSNITSQLFCYFPKEWQFRLLNVYTIQSRTTSTETVERFQNMYFEASLRKEFGIQQPNLKFYNLKLVFFKDYNGNRIVNDNEPGIKNVLATIQRVDNTNDYPDFSSGELLSNQFGEVLFENIPAGLYQLNYNPIGNEAGNFSKSEIELTINLKKDETYYIPFSEKNKVFGKIVMNRSRLSGLGKVDVSNIRITATDSRGNTFSTLTNKEGQFIIYAPVTDEYVVNINNIFYENFDLRQNNFRVQFNGYKQFEVNFVFDEKIRRINFSPSTQDNLAEGVMQIRRTNLRGTIKDATSLKPLRARINLVNTKNNSIVSSVYSNAQTGDYGLSFLADDIYLLEIVADDYWYFSENLNLNQVTTFMNVTKDILLKQITIGSKIELNIRFAEINKSNLGPETVAELNRLLRILKDNSNIKIEIQGHCDDLEAINNPQIGEERAKAVAKYLIENDFSNLQVRGFGNTAPIAPSDTEENRTLNRRVDIEVISK